MAVTTEPSEPSVGVIVVVLPFCVIVIDPVDETVEFSDDTELELTSLIAEASWVTSNVIEPACAPGEAVAVTAV